MHPNRCIRCAIQAGSASLDGAAISEGPERQERNQASKQPQPHNVKMCSRGHSAKSHHPAVFSKSSLGSVEVSPSVFLCVAIHHQPGHLVIKGCAKFTLVE
jgi:hypothetical protein